MSIVFSHVHGIDTRRFKYFKRLLTCTSAIQSPFVLLHLLRVLVDQCCVKEESQCVIICNMYLL